MLSQAAQLDAYATPGQRSHASERLASVLSPDHVGVSSVRGELVENVQNGSFQYALVAQGLLTALQVIQLVARYVPFVKFGSIADAVRDQDLNNSIIHTSPSLPENVSSRTH
jgi:hypothetical protein